MTGLDNAQAGDTVTLSANAEPALTGVSTWQIRNEQVEDGKWKKAGYGDQLTVELAEGNEYRFVMQDGTVSEVLKLQKAAEENAETADEADEAGEDAAETDDNNEDAENAEPEEASEGTDEPEAEACESEATEEEAEETVAETGDELTEETEPSEETEETEAPEEDTEEPEEGTEVPEEGTEEPEEDGEVTEEAEEPADGEEIPGDEENGEDAEAEENGEDAEAEEPGEETEGEPEERTLPENRSAVVSISWDEEEPGIGSVAHFSAELIGYEELNYTVQWIMSTDNENWEEVEGATGETMDVVVTEDNYLNYWRIRVHIEGFKDVQ